MTPRAYTVEERAVWLPVLLPVTLAAHDRAALVGAIEANLRQLVGAVAVACDTTVAAVDAMDADAFVSCLADVCDRNTAALHAELAALNGAQAHGAH